MSQTQYAKEDPLNLGGGWTASAQGGGSSSCPRRRRGAPVFKRHYHCASKAKHQPPGKHPQAQQGQGPWFQPPPRSPWSMCSNWGPWDGPCHPPPIGFWNAPGPVPVIWMYGLHPFCHLCCCSCPCLQGAWNPGCVRPPSTKKRWGRWGRRGRQPRRMSEKDCAVDLSTLLRPVNLYGWRAPGMRAPRNTTQFIMNQVYEDMRQQEKLERQQKALRAQQAPEDSGASPTPSNSAPPCSSGEDPELQETLSSFMPDAPLAFSPQLGEVENPPLNLQLGHEEAGGGEKNHQGEEEVEGVEDDDEESEKEEESEDEEDMEVAAYAEQGGRAETMGHKMAEEGLAKHEQKEAENDLSLEMPLSFLLDDDDDERVPFLDCSYLCPDEMIMPREPQDALLMVQDI